MLSLKCTTQPLRFIHHEIIRGVGRTVCSNRASLTISPLLLHHSKQRCYSVPRLTDMPQREELTRAPQGALPFPAQSRWARRVPLAIEGKGEGNGQVQGDPQAEGHGDKHLSCVKISDTKFRSFTKRPSFSRMHAGRRLFPQASSSRRTRPSSRRGPCCRSSSAGGGGCSGTR